MNSGRLLVSCALEAWRNGAFYKTLNAGSMSVRMEADAGIKVAFSGRIAFDPDLDLLADRFRPYQIVDGARYPMGEFLITTASEHTEGGGRWWEAEGYDQTLLLQQATLTQPLRFPAGTPYLDAVKSLLATAGIGRVMAEPSALALSADREDWELGTSLLDVANGLLSEINYRGVWFDRDGVARLAPAKAAAAENITQSYPAGQSTLLEGFARESDAFSAYNVFTAVYSAPGAAPLVSVAVNNDPRSPLSTVRRGVRACAPVEYVDGIASQDELDAYAARLLSESLLSHETVQFETAPVPSHWIGEIVAAGGAIYQETGWELQLGEGGSYTHTARRSVAI